MTKIQFELDGKQVEAVNGETIWQVAKRQGNEIPHLCYSPEPDYRPDGNCRACMVEVEGERVLAASCKRTPSVGMKVKSASPRAVAAQKMVMELLVADQPARESSHDPESKFWHWAEKVEVTESRFPAAERWEGDASHPAMSVNLDACIQCGLCVRACREVQVNDGYLAARGCCAHGHVLLRMFRARHHPVPLSSSYLACHLRHNPLSGSRQTKRGALSARSLTAT